jgi:cell division protease FtsH
LLPGVERLQKVSIIPRGLGALGYTLQRPTEDRFLMSAGELHNKLAGLLAGRAAELAVFGDTSTGAADDLAKATEIARAMVMRYGMSEKLGPVAYEGEPLQSGNGGVAAMPWERQRFSESTAHEIDRAVKGLIEDAADRAGAILLEHTDHLYQVAERLLVAETLTTDDLLSMLQSGRNACHHV